jgi:hypothetical protein
MCSDVLRYCLYTAAQAPSSGGCHPTWLKLDHEVAIHAYNHQVLLLFLTHFSTNATNHGSSNVLAPSLLLSD